jgi:predicted double-glycine peptidase
VQWHDGRFAVLYKVKDDTCFLSDTVMGLIEMSQAAFCQQWYAGDSGKGTVLLAEPAKKEE